MRKATVDLYVVLRGNRSEVRAGTSDGPATTFASETAALEAACRVARDAWLEDGQPAAVLQLGAGGRVAEVFRFD